MATYGVQARLSGESDGSFTSNHRRVRRELEQFPNGGSYEFWFVDRPKIVSMTRQTQWWVSLTFGLFGAVVLLLAISNLLGITPAALAPNP